MTLSDVKIEQKQVLGRQEAARFIAALAEGLGDDGRVTVRLGSSTLELSVANQVECELEVAVDGDEIELELELKWSISGRPSVEASQDQSEVDLLEEDEFSDEEPGEARSAGEDEVLEAPPEEAPPEEAPSEEAPSEEALAGAAAAEASEPPRRGRRRAAATTGEPSFNGVDNAAVRAWAAANGLAVSPRGRIKDEVIEAYRAAGN